MTRSEPDSLERPLCIGHSPPSAQQAIRASGVTAHPAHTAAFPAIRPKQSKIAARRCTGVTAVKNARMQCIMSNELGTWSGELPILRSEWTLKTLAPQGCAERSEGRRNREPHWTISANSQAASLGIGSRHDRQSR